MRFSGSLKFTGTAVQAPTITMPPFTFGARLARYVLSSASVGASGGRIWVTSPLTEPLVDGVHGMTSNLMFAFTGDVIYPLARPGSQPSPFHVNGSSCAFFMPQLVIV